MEITLAEINRELREIEMENPHFPGAYNEVRASGCTCTTCQVGALPREWEEYDKWSRYYNLRWLRGDF